MYIKMIFEFALTKFLAYNKFKRFRFGMEIKIMIEGQKRCISLCILESEEEYLLIRRGKRKKDLSDLSGFYIPIGGKLEPYETFEDAVIREIKEETGIDINNPIFLGVLTETSPLPKYNNVVYFFSKKILKQKTKECDEGYFEWIKKENVTNIQAPEIDKMIYKYLEKNQKFIINAVYDDKLNLIKAYEYLDNKKLK